MKKVYITISVLVLAYIVLRAICVPFTHDEAYTYLSYIQVPVVDIILYENPTANNHILNTLLAKLCSIFSVSEFSLRLPAVLAGCLYLYTCYKVCRLLVADHMLQLCFFIALLANTALIDFFSLCRGYGLGISLMMFAVYQCLLLTKADGNNIYKLTHATLLSCMLATYANFALMVPALGLFLFIFLHHYQYERKFWRAARLPFIYGLSIVALCAYPIYRLIKANELYHGGDNNFIDDTMYTMMVDMTDNWVQEPGYRDTLMVPFVLITAISIGIAVYRLIVHKNKDWSFLLVPLLLLFCIIMVNLQFYLMGTKLLTYRTALYLYPLIVVCAFSASQLIKLSLMFKRMSISSLTALLLLGFLLQANIDHTREWWFDSDNKKMLEYIVANRPANERKIKLFTNWLMSYSANYYIATRYSEQIEAVPLEKDNTRNLDLSSFDFVFIRKQDQLPPSMSLGRPLSFDNKRLLLYSKSRSTN
ncbi:MAG: hypothetical protein EOP56_13770 [Sphingobacteriales bacterium]|nr:MAG: hypothetical protein EOP56_13770 [Sphingobacteriales bacterium]